MTVLIVLFLTVVAFLGGGFVALAFPRTIGRPQAIEAIGNDGTSALVRLECERGTVLVQLDGAGAYAVSNQLLQLAAVLAPRAPGG